MPLDLHTMLAQFQQSSYVTRELIEKLTMSAGGNISSWVGSKGSKLSSLNNPMHI